MGFGVGEAFGPLGEIVEGQVKGVKDGAADGGDVGVGSAKPGLDVGSWSGGGAHGKTFRNSLVLNWDRRI